MQADQIVETSNSRRLLLSFRTTDTRSTPYTSVFQKSDKDRNSPIYCD